MINPEMAKMMYPAFFIRHIIADPAIDKACRTNPARISVKIPVRDFTFSGRYLFRTSVIQPELKSARRKRKEINPKKVKENKLINVSRNGRFGFTTPVSSTFFKDSSICSGHCF